MRRFGADRAAKWMERVGMDDDMPIEARPVSAMLESAQTKVEGFNFDIRKNVVEYDDVIAAQRERHLCRSPECAGASRHA